MAMRGLSLILPYWGMKLFLLILIGLYNKNQQTNRKGNTQMDNGKEERANFSSHLGYVLAAAGASVGLGNIWRFPYLASKYGGGIFLLVYLILMVIFGYPMVISETVLGKMTKKSPVGAFRQYGKKFPYKFGGWINAIIPVIILPYYSVIGGWVIKYMVEYFKGNAMTLASDGYFSAFITGNVGSEMWFILFSAFTFLIILLGVKNGIEKASKVLMPVLIVLSLGIMGYTVTRPGAMNGVKYLLVPDFSHFSLMTIVAAMGQMFYSLSIAMGILYTYGSYLKPEADIEKTTLQVEVFDFSIALVSALIIIPSVFSFSGGDAATLNAGPSLMFITLPKVFASTGVGNIIGAVFFFLVFLAALTSSIALLESAISTFTDELGWKRSACCVLMVVICLVLGSLSSLGYGCLENITMLKMQFLDFFDFLTNSLMMPIAAIATCFLILFKVGLPTIVKEVSKTSAFKRKKLYCFSLKYLAIICILLIFVTSILSAFGVLII